ncbi:Ig-like domain-containing protein, partial [Microcoleus sp. MON2_D5]|uniref:Ig-like domain-containing protein n=1 Tax=Microcoleus sp. MON2_D5 TaxID=2818833 RepID=UPI002FCF501F
MTPQKNASQLIFIDSNVEDYQSLINGVSPNAEVIILDETLDGIEQITERLAIEQNIEAIHIISHGSPGSVHLGTNTLNSSNIKSFGPGLKQWRKALIPRADILLYGCNVAAGHAGYAFLTQLHQLTGANIAANTNTTGNSERGGTWDIPQLIPPSPHRPKLAVTETTLKTYSGLLGFAPKVDLSTGRYPLFVSTGNFNGDGKLDLATVNYSDNSVSILLNTTPTGATTPTFASKVDFSSGGVKPWDLSIDDFNGDGQPDLAVTNSNSNTVSILLNTTTAGATAATFASNVNFSTSAQPLSVESKDFNGDNLPDLAVANTSSSTVSILLNTTTANATTPTFAPRVDFRTGAIPYSVSVGDFNGDSKFDLAAANRDNDSVSILLNTTDAGATTPAFASKVDFPSGTKPLAVSSGDLNGDGKPDLAVANIFTDTASILLNTTATGATAPDFAPQVTFGTGDGPYSPSIDDVNDDGKPDLAVANNGSDTASILLNTTAPGATTPTFATKVDFTTGDGPRSTIIDDINGDGKPDLAVANGFSNSVSILLNTTPKVTAVTATNPDGSYGVGSTINITVTFDAAVNVDTTGGTPQLLLETGTTDRFATYTSGSGTTALTFNYVVQAPDTSGDLEYLATTALTLNGGTIKDNLTGDAILGLPATATPNSLGGSKAIVIDTIVPTVALKSASPTTTNAAFLVTATFSESVTGFIASDVNLTNSTLSNFTGSGTTYNFTVTPNADGPVTVDVPAATATDLAGNNNTAATQLTRSADITAPTVALKSASPTTTNAAFLVTATFSESVTGFIASDVNLTNSTISNFTGSGTTYNFTVTPNADGPVTVDVPAATATDIAGNNNTAATQLTRTNDATAPTVALTSASPTITNAPFSVTATFSEDVTGFDNTDITVANATVGNFVTVDAKTYTFDVTPNADGNVTVDVLAATANDTGGNNNTAATRLTRTADFTAPTVALTSASATRVNAAFSVTATFSENVTGFDNTDITVTNATVGNFVTVDAKTYTFDVTPNADGPVTVDVLAALAKDTASNNNTAATQLVRNANFTAPTASLGTISNITTAGGTSQTLTVTFSDSSGVDVSSLDNSDLVVNWSGGAIPAT